jgi:predicted nucleic acid-binding protein
VGSARRLSGNSSGAGHEPSQPDPAEKNWLESGQILAKIHADRAFTTAQLRDLHFDVLIALIARSSGAHLATSNHPDFEMIGRQRNLQLEIW